jgi:hypothetical protein
MKVVSQKDAVTYVNDGNRYFVCHVSYIHDAEQRDARIEEKNKGEGSCNMRGRGVVVNIAIKSVAWTPT